jgi:predicted RNA binding protein YcfA (HicA-like mRNA interferase family)
MRLITSREFIKILQDNGWYYVRSRGSHLHFEKKGCSFLITFPNKRKDLNPLLVCRLLKLIDKSNKKVEV